MKTLVLALTVAGSVAFTSSAFAQQDAFLKYCKPDIDRLCSMVPPGQGRVLKCLKANGDKISVGCAKVLQKLKG